MESNHHQLTTTETSHQGQQPATTMQYRLIDLLTQYPDKWKPVSSLQTFLKEQFFKIYGKNIDSMQFITPALRLYKKKLKVKNAARIINSGEEFLTSLREVFYLDDEHSDESPDEHSDVTPDDHSDVTPDHSDVISIGPSDDHSDGIPADHSDESPYEHSDVTPDDHSDVTSTGTSDVSSDDHSDVTPDDHSDESPDEHSDVSSDVTPDDHSDATSTGTSDVSFDDLTWSGISGAKKRKPLSQLGARQKKRRLEEFKKYQPEMYSLILEEARKEGKAKNKKMSPERAVGLMSQAKLSRGRLDKVRTFMKDDIRIPGKNSISAERDRGLPAMLSSETEVIVPMEEMVKNTVPRLCQQLGLELSGEVTLDFKIGMDAQGTHSNYAVKETCRSENRKDDSDMYLSVLTPLELRYSNSGEVIWRNKTPNSPNYTRILRVAFEKETKAAINLEYNRLSNEIFNLEEISFPNFNLTSQVYFVLLDGKSLTHITENLLGMGDQGIATQSCHVCLKSSKAFMSETIFETNDDLNPEILDHGCAPLHTTMRVMENIFNISLRSHIPYRVSLESAEFKALKAEAQEKFKSLLKIDLFKVKQGKGNSNCGNNAKIFLENFEITADILGVDVELIEGFNTLLSILNSTSNNPDLETFRIIRDDLFYRLTQTEPLNKYPMSSSTHRLLVHSLAFFEHLAYPPGVLSESAIESRNRLNKHYREFLTFKGSLAANILDMAKRMLMDSDPIYHEWV